MRFIIVMAMLLSMPAFAENFYPTDSAIKTPPFIYDSAFREYKPYVDAPIGLWRQVNDEVKNLGGHIGHVRDLTLTPDSSRENKSPNDSTQHKH